MIKIQIALEFLLIFMKEFKFNEIIKLI